MTSTAAAFATAREEGRAALVGYLPAGFPDVEGAVEAIGVMVEHGCDVIEIGLPYSDPVMDGPTIQAAAQQALEAGIRTTDVLRVVEAVADTDPDDPADTAASATDTESSPDPARDPRRATAAGTSGEDAR